MLIQLKTMVANTMQANAFQVNSMFIRTQWLRMDYANTVHVYQLKRMTAIPDFTLPAQDQNYHIAHCAKELLCCYITSHSSPPEPGAQLLLLPDKTAHSSSFSSFSSPVI